MGILLNKRVLTNKQYWRKYKYLQSQLPKISKYRKGDYRVVDFYRRYNFMLTRHFIKKIKVKLKPKPNRTVGSSVSIRRNLWKERARVRKKDEVKHFKQYQILTVTVKTNNVFCILTDQDNNCLVRACSPKRYGITTSRKSLRQGCIDFLRKYRKETKEKKIKFSDNFVIRIKSPGALRKVIYKQIKGLFIRQMRSKYFSRKKGFLKRIRRERRSLQYKNRWRKKQGLEPLKLSNEKFPLQRFVFDIKQGIPFNGCRSVKLRRKKSFIPRVFSSH